MELFTYLMAKNDHNTSVKKDLFSYLLGKNQSGTYTDYSGTSLSINNTKKAKMKVNLLGNTSQTGTPTPSSPIPVNVVSGDNEVVVTGKNLFDENYYNNSSLYGGGTRYFTTVKMPDSFKTKFYGNMILKGTSQNLVFGFSTTDQSLQTRILDNGTLNSNVEYDFTNATDVYLIIGNSNGVDAATDVPKIFNNYNIMISKTSGDPYEPYQSQTYPIHLGEYELCKTGTYQDKFIRNSGKNLFDVSTSLTKSFIKKSNGKIGTSDDWSASDFIEIKPNTQYIYSGVTNSWSSTACTAFYDENKTYLNVSVASNVQTFTTPSNAKYLKLSLNTETPTFVVLNEGSTALPYEPYGNGDWYLEKKIGKITLDGNNVPFTVRSSSTANVIYVTNNNLNINDFVNGYSNRFIVYASTLYTTDKIGIYIEDKRIRCGFGLSSTLTTLELANEWLRNNNVIVYYPLPAPTYTKIEGTLKDELEAVWRAYSYNGQTNISQINNDLPFELNVSVKVGS